MISEHIDDIVDFKYRALNKIKNSPEILSLIANIPDIDMDSDEAENAEKRIYDYDYVDDTTVEDGAYVMVETEMRSLDSDTMKTMIVYIHIVCSKGYMELNKFKGMRGNRRDNLVRWCDAVLADDFGYGVGILRLSDVAVASAPSTFTASLMTYTVPNFA